MRLSLLCEQLSLSSVSLCTSYNIPGIYQVYTRYMPGICKSVCLSIFEQQSLILNHYILAKVYSLGYLPGIPIQVLNIWYSCSNHTKSYYKLKFGCRITKHNAFFLLFAFGIPASILQKSLKTCVHIAVTLNHFNLNVTHLMMCVHTTKTCIEVGFSTCTFLDDDDDDKSIQVFGLKKRCV